MDEVASLAWHLERVDRWLALWASYERRDALNIGTVHPLEKIRQLADGVAMGSAPEPLWLDHLDRELRDAPIEHRALVKVWYCSGGPVKRKAGRLCVSVARLYTMREAALNFLYARLRDRLGDFP